MNEYVIIILFSLLGSALTFFSGFGLGTILVPVFGIFFPIDVAIALTAIVHFLNNVFKFFLVGKHVNKEVLLKFGVPSVIAALIGAWCLSEISSLQSLYSYAAFDKTFEVKPVKAVVAVLMIFFAMFELIPALSKLSFDKKYLPLGGVLSGFFGGLSGNQGALRSAFLLRSGLTKDSFIATGVSIACLIDITRLSVYAQHFTKQNLRDNLSLLAAATLAAFAGALIGNKLLKKTTFATVQIFVAVMLIVFALFLGIGII
jgi:uncharacterized protein